MDPTTGYAQIGDQRIAYSVIGDGPSDLTFRFGFWGSFHVELEDRAWRFFYEQMASYARVIRYDQRGSGASDSIAIDALPPPTRARSWSPTPSKTWLSVRTYGFEDLGALTLKGFGGEWQLFSVIQPDAAA